MVRSRRRYRRRIRSSRRHDQRSRVRRSCAGAPPLWTGDLHEGARARRSERFPASREPMMRQMWRRCGQAAFAVLLLLPAVPLKAACECKPAFDSSHRRETATVFLDSSLPSGIQDAVAYGMGMWNAYFVSVGMPEVFRFVSIGPGEINVYADPTLHNSGNAAVIDYG